MTTYQHILAAMTIGCLAPFVAAEPPPTPGRFAAKPVRVRAEAQDEKFNQAVPAPGDPRDVLFVRGEPAHMGKGSFLGVSTSPATPVLREQLKLGKGMGLVVDFVEPESPAAAAGLKKFDVLTRVGDQILINPQQLVVLVRSYKVGDEIDLTVLRGGTETKLKAKLTEKEMPPLEDFLFIQGGDLNMPPFDIELLGPHGLGLPGAPGAEIQWPPRVMKLDGQRGGTLSTTVWADGEHTLVITSQGDGHKKLVAKDKSGTVLFDGLIDSPEAREKLPAAVAEKLQKLEAATPAKFTKPLPEPPPGN